MHCSQLAHCDAVTGLRGFRVPIMPPLEVLEDTEAVLEHDTWHQAGQTRTDSAQHALKSTKLKETSPQAILKRRLNCL